MLATARNVNVDSGVETNLVTWIADGAKEVVGYVASSPFYVPVEYYLYVGGALHSVFRASPEVPTAFLVDKPFVPTVGMNISVKAKQETGSPITCDATLLGG